MPEPRTITTDWFHADLLRSLRKEAGWTQEELAARADLSVRVIAKAEKGESVAAKTVAAITAAFQSAGVAVASADFTVNPAALAKRFLSNYALYQADCVEYSLDMLAPDIVAFVAGDPDANPIAGEYRGVDEFAGLWKKFFSIFVRAGGTIDEPQMMVAGNQVIAWGHENIHVPEVPPKEPGFVMLRMTFSAGRMVRFEDYYEAASMMQALRLFAPVFPHSEWAKLINELGAEAPAGQQPAEE